MAANSASAQLASGTLLSRYRIRRLLGAGGMGEVYEATDAQLGRRVALKILPASRASDPVRAERFLREAQTASALNHPAIVSVFDAGTATGPEGAPVRYLAMELIEGETLAEWARGTRDFGKRIEVLAQIADALACAHASGIVHRDLKPENIMVARGGHPKVVDFGVAKLTERMPGPSPADSDTAPNALLGTAAYMAPEQVEASSVDHRADVFAFGSVLHAVFGGRSPFARGSVIDTMHAILHDDAPALPHASAALQRIARRCLARDPDERYQSMRDAALDLREAASESAPSATAPQSRRLFALLALLAVVMLGSIGSVILVRREAVAPASSTAAPPPQALMLRLTNSGRVMGSAISPDGNYLVYTEQKGNLQSIFVKQIATGRTVRVMPATPAWFFDLHVSADGNYVYYAAATVAEPNVSNLYQLPLLGGVAVKIASDIDAPIAVSPDGKRIAFRRFNAIQRENILYIADLETKSERIVLMRRPPDFIGSVAWTPDGKKLSFVAAKPAAPKGVALWELDVATGRIDPIPAPPWPGIGTICWLPDSSGMVLTVSDLRQPQQPPQLWFLPRAGNARKITNDIAAYGSATATADSKGVVAARTEVSANISIVRLSDPDKLRAVTSDVGNRFGTGGVRWLSPHEIVYTAFESGPLSVNVMNLANGEVRQIARGCCTWNPVVSPDGTKIAALVAAEGRSELAILDRDGNRIRQFSTDGAISPAWFPDGKSIAYVSNGSTQRAWQQPLDGPRTPLSNVPVNSIRISPDGKSMLCRYRLEEPGKPLWRTAILPVGGGAPRFFPIPRFGGPHLMEWSPDGRGFFFTDSEDDIANVWFQPLDGSAPRPVTRFETGRIWAYDLSPDGKSLVVSHGDVLNDAVLLRDFR